MIYKNIAILINGIKKKYDHWMLMVLAIVVGAIAGYGAIGFYKSLNLIQEFLYGAADDNFTTAATTGQIAWWKILLIPIAGGLLVGQLLRFLPENRANAVPSVIESAALHDSRIDIKNGFFSAIVSSLSLSFGASMGREGPVVHLGASLASFVTKRLGLSPNVAKILLGCGVASAVAASFNAPIAGVFFAHEVIIGHYALHAFTPIVISAIIGTLISRAYLGDFPAFMIHDYNIQTFWEFPAFFMLGIVSAIVAIIFMTTADKADKFKYYKEKFSYKVRPAIGGLFIGLLALCFPQVLGVGYEATSNALNGQYGLWLLIGLVIAKILATTVSMASGFGGGVFSPSLFIGAMTGGAMGYITAAIFPELASDPGLYAIVGMGAVASSVLGAPISTTLIVFEITGDYSVTIAVMIASAVSSLVSTLYHQTSIFHMQLANRGIRLEGGKATYLLKTMTVASKMESQFTTIPSNHSIAEAQKLLLDKNIFKIFVTDEKENFIGSLNLHEIVALLNDKKVNDETSLSNIIREDLTFLQASDPLETALSLMETSGEDCLPVVESHDSLKLTGALYYNKVMRAYNQALLETHGRDNSN